jgi:mannosyltransferase
MISKHKFIVLLILIVLLGTGLRFYNLSEEALWTDEMVTLHTLRQDGFGDVIWKVAETELTPPGHFIMMWKWIDIFGESEFSLRFLSALFDILAIILVYLIGSRFNRRVGIISALFFATTMLQVLYAQEARMYSLFGLLVLLSTYLLIRYAENRKFLWLYIVTMALSLYVNYMAFFMMLLHLVILFYYKREILKEFVLASFVALLLFIPGMRILFHQIMLRQPILQKAFVAKGIPLFLANMGIGFYMLPLGILVLGMVIAVPLFKRLSIEFKRNGLILLLIIFILVHLYFLDITLRSFSLIRHSFFIIPFFYIGIAYVLDKIKWKNALIIGILLFNVFTLAVYYTETTKAPWDEAALYIEENIPKGTLLVFDRSGSNERLYEYYASIKYPHMIVTWEENRKFVQMDDDLLLERLDNEGRFVLVSSRNVRASGYYQKLFEKYDLILHKEYRELDLYYYSG